MNEQQQLEAGIASLQAQRALLGDAVVDAALGPMRARLQALQTPAQTLRQVSVLFLDVVGSTALAAELDPEAVHAVMDSTLAACSEVVRKHGGTVLQYAGDSLLAAFGTPQAYEDDAERAVRCGLALLPLGAELGARVQREHGHAGCHVRVGIHTGPVLLGGGVDEGGTIRGVTVNLAARMEQAAPPGALRISQATWSQVRGAFDLEEQPPLQVKGAGDTLRTWLVQAARPRSFRLPTRGVEGLETPMVGRDAELAQLLAVFDRVVATQQPWVVTLLADAGLGKSRLLHELQHALDGPKHPFCLLLGRAQAGGLLQPYGLLRDVLAWRLQIADSDTPEVARRKLVDGLAPTLSQAGAADGLLQAQLLGQLLGMDFSAQTALAAVLTTPRQLRDRALAAFAEWLQALAARHGAPVLMLLDDLQWADDASLDALQQLQAQAELPLLLLAAARPSLLERRPGWCQGWARHCSITLSELAGPAQGALTRTLLQRLGDVPPPLLALIGHHAAGNPFYAEELVKMLIDEGVIAVTAEGWHFHAERLRPTHVPGTLTGVLQARLDALAAAERHALQMASVVGPVFWDQALASLDAQALATLAVLQQRALVHARPVSTFEGTGEQAFQHHLLHQVTYETVLKAERQGGHARAAVWLAERVGARSAEYLGVVAEHFERAGDAATAFAWYERAADAAAARYAQAAVIASVDRALALRPPPADARRQLRLLKTKANAADVMGRRDVQADVLAQRHALALQLGDEAALAGVLSSQALLADRLGERERAGALAREGLALAERIGAASDAAICWGELAWLSRQRGDVTQALHEAEAGLVWARRARAADPGQAVYEMQLLAVMAYMLGAEHQREREREVLHQSLALATERGELRVQCSAHQMLADAALALAEPDEAQAHLEALRATAAVTGEVVHQGSVHLLAARIALHAASAHAEATDAGMASAEGHAQAAYAIYLGAGGREFMAQARLLQGMARVQAGRPDAAQAPLREAAALWAGVGDDGAARVCRAWLAWACALAGDTAAAQAWLDAEGVALQDPKALGDDEFTLQGRVALWRAFERLQHAAGARQQLVLAAAELRRRVAWLYVGALRQRVLQQVPLHRQIVEGCQAAGLPPF